MEEKEGDDKNDSETNNKNMRDNEKESRNISKIESESEISVIIIKYSERGNENLVYISVKGSHCTATPPVADNNRTPPPIVSPHSTTINFHLILLLIKYCVASLDSCSLN